MLTASEDEGDLLAWGGGMGVCPYQGPAEQLEVLVSVSEGEQPLRSLNRRGAVSAQRGLRITE